MLEARSVNACTCPSNSWILSWAPVSLEKPSPQHIGHFFSDIETPFIAGGPTSVVVKVDVAVADMTTWGPGINRVLDYKMSKSSGFSASCKSQKHRRE